ncbi:hypothetical protein NEOKW01_1668 [Nematocida sp. AWRm80]|nr:hypothetical protein NEOKW01_1668 [Nematocida sp. AWRm80]
MDIFVIDDLVLELFKKRNDILKEIYTKYKSKIEAIEYTDVNTTINRYISEIETRNKRKSEEREKKKKSMVVHIDDMSFSFGREELKQLSGPDKEMDPEIKLVLEKMNDLFIQLNNHNNK